MFAYHEAGKNWISDFKILTRPIVNDRHFKLLINKIKVIKTYFFTFIN